MNLDNEKERQFLKHKPEQKLYSSQAKQTKLNPARPCPGHLSTTCVQLPGKLTTLLVGKQYLYLSSYLAIYLSTYWYKYLMV